MSTLQIMIITLSAVVFGGIGYAIVKRLRKVWQKNHFREYGVEVHRFELASDGAVEFAQWLHPKEGPKEITQQQVDRLRRFIRAGDTVIDIGAYTGDTTIPMALAAGSDGCTLALEPNRYVFKVLAKNALLNRDKTNVVPLNFAATSEDGSFTFNYSDASFCNGGFLSQINNPRHGHPYALQVEGKNLSAFVRREYAEQLERLTFIKIDAEGYDRQVLLSLTDLIAQYRPTIQCEVYKRLDASEREALFDVIDTVGYECFKLADGNDLQGERLTREAMNNWKHFDILAVPRAERQRAAA